MVQWLRLSPPSNAGGKGSIPGGGTKILHVTQHSQKINKYVNKQNHIIKQKIFLNNYELLSTWINSLGGEDRPGPHLAPWYGRDGHSGYCRLSTGVTGTCSQNSDKIILRANLDRFKILLICARSLHKMFTATLQAHP